jgi:hypothetical protein
MQPWCAFSEIQNETVNNKVNFVRKKMKHYIMKHISTFNKDKHKHGGNLQVNNVSLCYILQEYLPNHNVSVHETMHNCLPLLFLLFF